MAFLSVYQSRYNNYGPPQGKTPLRENTYAREANIQSFGAYDAAVETGDVILAEHGICVLRTRVCEISIPFNHAPLCSIMHSGDIWPMCRLG